MRSLWRILALRWLGGEGSAALTDASGLFDMLKAEKSERTFNIQREPGVSHHAMMLSNGQPMSEPVMAEPIARKSGG